MKVENTTLPISQIEIDVKNNKSIITLWNGIYTTQSNSNVDIIENKNSSITYIYDIYIITVPFRSNLLKDIQSNFDVWYNFAKNNEIKKNLEKVNEQENKNITTSIPNILLDYDYRLMLLEEEIV